MNRNRNPGFTLIELLIVMVVFSILLAVAAPSYMQFIRESRRDDAKHLLLLNSQRLQRCFTLVGEFTTGDEGEQDCFLRQTSDNGYYELADTSIVTEKTFYLVAVPVDDTSQDDDAGCTHFSYDQTGRQSAQGSDSENCW